MFEALIGEAGQDERGRGRIGAMFLNEASMPIPALVADDGLEPAATYGLARVYARVDVETAPALVQRLIAQMGELHRKLDERIGVLPGELRAAFAYEVECREEAACGWIAMRSAPAPGAARDAATARTARAPPRFAQGPRL